MCVISKHIKLLLGMWYTNKIAVLIAVALRYVIINSNVKLKNYQIGLLNAK